MECSPIISNLLIIIISPKIYERQKIFRLKKKSPLITLQRLYEEALSVEGIVGLCIGTRPDCIYPEVLDLLENYAQNYLIWLEYGLQTFHEKSLQRINRGHGIKEFLQAIELTRLRKKINICTHLILGLPGEKKSDMMATALELSKLEIQGIKLHLLYVIKGTALAEMFYRGEYRCLNREEYIDIFCEFLQYLTPTMVIQRIISDPHPDELVAPSWVLEKRKNRQMIEKALEEKNILQGQKIHNSPPF